MQHARLVSNRKAVPNNGSDENVVAFLRHLQQTPNPMGRMNANQTSLVVGQMSHHSVGSTLTIGKNKVHSTLGDPKTSPQPPTPRNIQPKRAEKILLHTSDVFDEPVQLSVWFHEPRNFAEEIIVDKQSAGGFQEGQIYLLVPLSNKNKDQLKLIFVIRKKNFAKEPAKNSPNFPATTAKTKTNFTISLISNPLQKLLDIPPRSAVTIQRVPDVLLVELDAVEIYLKDVNLSRDSQWNLSSSLVGTCCYVNQRILFLGSRIGHVKLAFKDGHTRFSGYIGENTNIIFRSESARLVFLVQMSREMWHFEENGEIMFHKLVNTLFPEVFKNWRQNDAHHSITIVLFTSVDLTKIPWINLGGGERPSRCQDYYRVVVDQVSVFSWDRIMASLRLEFANFKRDILMHIEEGVYQISGEPCPAAKGNLLEAINLSLSLVCDRFRNTDLRHSVNHMIVITAGTGLFDVDYDLMAETSKKMFSVDCALDIVCLSQPPLHTVPLFRYKDARGLISHCVPKWCDISFYSGSNDQSHQWIPRCKIYELQMMGVMENESNDSQIERLNLKRSLLPLDAMEEYDNNLFTAVRMSINGKQLPDRLPQKSVLPKASLTTFSLMGKTMPILSAPTDSSPAASEVNVSTNNSTVHGTLANPSITSSALASLYNLNKADDDKKKITALIKAPLIKPSVSSIQNEPSKVTKSEPLRKKDNNRRLSFTSERMQNAKNRNKKIQEKKVSLSEQEETERKNNHPYWMEIKNPSRESASNTISCSRWANAFPPKVKRKSVKWRSLKTPAALPISTTLFPTLQELESEYTFQIYILSLNWENKLELKTTAELMREMIRLRLATGFQICRGERVRNIEADRKPTGSPESLITFLPEGNCVGARIYMSLNEEIHRIFCDYNGTLNVQLYRKTKAPTTDLIKLGANRTRNETPPLIRTRYADEYTLSQINIHETKPYSYNWNQFDQLLAGYEDAVSSISKEFHKMKFVVMPGEIPANAYHINNEKLTDEEIRVEGLRKLIATVERGKFSRTEEEKVRTKKEEILPEINFYTGNLYDFLNEQVESFDISGTQPTNSLMASGSSKFNTNINISSLAQQLQGPGGLKLVDRTWHFKTHPQCFVGQELVSWLIKYFEDIDNRENATAYGQAIMDAGLFQHVENRHGFLDGHYFYEFTEAFADPALKTKNSTGWFRKRAAQDDKNNSGSLHPSPVLNAQTSSSRLKTRRDSDAASLMSYQDLFPNNSKKSGHQIILQVDSESSSLADSQKARRKKKFVITKHVKFDCDPSKASFRPELLDVHYDRVHNPEHCYHIRFQWLNTTTKFIDETIISWSRLCERYGLKLVETPWRELCTIPKLNPFHSFVDLKLVVNPLTDDEFKDSDEIKENKFYFHLYFLKKADFLLDNRGTNFFSKDHIEITYTWGLPSFKFAQFIHKTGAYIVELRDNGDFFMAPNNVHIMRMNTLVSSIPEQSSNFKNYIFDSQKVMMDFRELCKKEEYLRSVFREAKKDRGAYDYIIA